MLKNNNKGYFLAETIIVLTVVALAITTLYVNSMESYVKEKNELTKYNTVDGLYSANAVKKYLYKYVNDFKVNANTNGYIDVNNYLISPNVDMQQLMETYLLYARQTDYYSNNLLLSEKHLCNETDFGDSFFTKVCTKEIENINRRLKNSTNNSQKEFLLAIKQILEERNKNFEQEKQEIAKSSRIELLSHSDAMYHLDGDKGTYHEFSLQNYSNEELYKTLGSKLGMLKVAILEILNDTLFDTDLCQYICGLRFVREDSSKLSSQKRQLMKQLKNNVEVNYENEQMQKILQRSK